MAYVLTPSRGVNGSLALPVHSILITCWLQSSMLGMMEKTKMIMTRSLFLRKFQFSLQRELKISNIIKGEIFTNATRHTKHYGNLECTRAGEGFMKRVKKKE